jgi:hypothetical protein
MESWRVGAENAPHGSLGSGQPFDVAPDGIGLGCQFDNPF